MSFLTEDDSRTPKKTAHEIGSDLSNLSADELSARITLLESEIERLKAERSLKSAGRAAAESLFRR